jgi:DNA-binding beta-propeller fold protein YncE
MTRNIFPNRFALCGVFSMLVLIGMVSGPSSAVAARAHAFSFAFGGAGTIAGEAGSLSLASEPKGSSSGSGLAVNATTHDVYVADTGNRRISEFTASGLFLRAWGWGVTTGAEELQVCTSTSSCKPGLSGSEPGEFEIPSYIAVDNAPVSPSKGDVYVADTGDNLVTKFDAEGHLIKSWGNNGEDASHKRTEPNGQLNGSPSELFTGGHPTVPIEGITVDGSGDLWVYDLDLNLFEFHADGTWIMTCVAFLSTSPGGGGIATNDGTSGGDIYVHGGDGRVQAFNAGCSHLGVVRAGVERNSPGAQGIAVDSSEGDLYVVAENTLVEDISATCVPTEEEGHGCVAAQVFGEGTLSDASGIAVDSEEGSVLVADASADMVDVFGTTLIAVPASASGTSAHGSTLHGLVTPEGEELSSCTFEFGSTTTYGSSAPCTKTSGEIGKGSLPVPVEAPIATLASGTTYHFRVHAVNGSSAVDSEDETFTTSPAPKVREVMTEDLSDTSATLEAVVNPEGISAHYHFEYGECPQMSGCVGAPFTVSVPEPDAELPTGISDVLVTSQPITDLTPGATYHFRIVIDGETAETPEGTFVFAPPTPACSEPRAATDGHLADCRAYEMITPPMKNGALINNGAFIEAPGISADGSRVLSQSLQCFEHAGSCTAVRQTEGSTFSFERLDSGWRTEPLTPPITTGSTSLMYNADSGVVLYARSAEPPALEELYARDPDGELSAIGPIAEDTGAHISHIATAQRASTPDLSRVVYQGNALWPSLEEGSSAQQVLTYSGRDNAVPKQVAVSESEGPGGEVSLISACGASLGGSKLPHSEYGSLSEDGEAVFFTAAPCLSGTGVNKGVAVPARTLYERVENGAGAFTVLVSGSGPVSQCDNNCLEQPPGDASFEGAAADGHSVLFTDTRQLTDTASEDHRSGDSAFSECAATTPTASGCNLYEFACPSHCSDESERKLIDVSSGDKSGLGPQVQGVLAIPPDGSDVYFVAHGVLTGKNGLGREPVAGGDNLYVYHFGDGGTAGHATFIETLSKSDSPEWLKQGGSGLPT